jgi:hypothetical protein
MVLTSIITDTTANTTSNTNTNNEYWLTSKVEDELYIEMCEKEISNPNSSIYGDTIKKYYLQCAKYAGRVSAGDFSDKNIPRPIIEITLSDFTPRLVTELATLRKEDMPTFKRVVHYALSRIFRYNHRMIYHEHIEPNGISWEVRE